MFFAILAQQNNVNKMGTWLKRNFYLFFFGIFALVGTGMGIGGTIFWLQSVNLSNNGVQTNGTVIEMIRGENGSTQAPVVEFVLKNGERHQYTSSMFSSPPAYELGEVVKLWYNPANPDEVLLSGMDSWFVPLLLGIFFLVFGGIGYGGLIYQWLKKRDITWLKQHGQVVEATLLGVHLNTSVKMNGASPFAIQCQWLDPSTNKVYVFDSDDIWFDPTTFIKGDTLPVLINPENPGLYTVDLSFLPEQGN